MKFEEMHLGTQVGMSLERYANFHDLAIALCCASICAYLLAALLPYLRPFL